MENKKSPKYGRVLFFCVDEENDSVFRLEVSSYTLSHADAVKVHETVPSIYSKLIEADTVDELNELEEELIEKIKDKEYCEKNIWPYIY